MATERLVPHFVEQPWGMEELPPSLFEVKIAAPIGEARFAGTAGGESRLSARLVFVDATLPPGAGDERDHGGAAWYVIEAAEGARLAVGPPNGPPGGAPDWQAVRAGAALAVAPGDAVAAEGRVALLAVEAARGGTAAPGAADGAAPWPGRTILISGGAVVLERLDLAPKTEFAIEGGDGLFLLVAGGALEIQMARYLPGEAAFHAGDRATCRTGPEGATLLAAYPGPAAHEGLFGAPVAAERGFWDEGHDGDPDQPVIGT